MPPTTLLANERKCRDYLITAESGQVLRLASATRGQSASNRTPASRQGQGAQLLDMVDRRPSWFGWLRIGWQPRWAMVGLVAQAIVVVSSGTAVVADSEHAR